MATGTSRNTAHRLVIAAGALLALSSLVVILALLHGSSAGAGRARAVASAKPSAGTLPRTFSWLRPAPPPSDWHVARLQAGSSALAYPPRWRTIQSDRGTVSAAVTDRSGTIVSYLNATPKSGGETLSNWTRFRPNHVADEGAHDVRLLAAAPRLRFRTGRGSCVMDSYSTSRARYEEIACLVAGGRASTVIVGAAEPGAWSAEGPAIERAIASFAT
jgi:hypothetical protein